MNSFSQKDQRPLRRRWEFLLLLLALLLSFVCVFSSTWFALNVQPEDLTSANMLPVSQADYGRVSRESTPFAPLNPGVGAEAATDVARLASTPVGVRDTPIAIVLLPATPTPTPTRTPTPTPTALPVATATPIPVASPTSVPTALPSPSATRALNPTPTSTIVPTVTGIGTATGTPTAISPPTPTPTATSPSTSTPTATSTPVPPTPIPTDTPEPTSTPAVPRPIVEAIAPNTRVNTATVAVTITGQNFQPDCTASLGSVSLIGISCPSTTTVTASVPAGIIAGYYDLTVTNPDGQPGSLTRAYTATNPVPGVAAITLNTWFTTTNRVVTITGDNFRNTGAPGNLRGALDGTPLTGVTYVSPTTLTATVPSSSASIDVGVYTLVITNPGPTDPAGSLLNAFTIITDTVPISPADLRAAAGDSKVVLGWEPNTEIDLAGYRIYRTDTGLLTETAGTSYLDLVVTNGTTYSYYVRTIDIAGHESLSSTIVSAQPYDIIPYTYTTSIAYTGIVTNASDAAGPPDGFASGITGTGMIILDFGVDRGIIDGPDYDMVLFEWFNPGVFTPTGGIHLDYVTLELSADGTTWYPVFDWNGDNPGDVVGTNIYESGYATDANGELESEPIPGSDLYPTGLVLPGPPPQQVNSGITIDIGAWTPPGYSFHLVRLRYPGGGANPGGNVDAVQRLN
jgi:hypothetical protein